MKRTSFLSAIGLALTLAISSTPIAASLQARYTIYGYVGVMMLPPPPVAASAQAKISTRSSPIVQSQAATVMKQQTQQATASRLIAKLRFPKGLDKPVLLSYPDATGAFSFPNLPQGIYLVEIYNGEKLLTERILRIESDVILAIPLGNLTSVSKGTVSEKKSWAISGTVFNNQVAVSIGEIELKKDTGKLSVTIGPVDAGGRPMPKSKPYFTGVLPNSWLLTQFTYNNQIYVMAGLLKRTGGQESMDCEIFRLQ